MNMSLYVYTVVCLSVRLCVTLSVSLYLSSCVCVFDFLPICVFKLFIQFHECSITLFICICQSCRLYPVVFSRPSKHGPAPLSFHHRRHNHRHRQLSRIKHSRWLQQENGAFFRRLMCSVGITHIHQ